MTYSINNIFDLNDVSSRFTNESSYQGLSVGELEITPSLWARLDSINIRANRDILDIPEWISAITGTHSGPVQQVNIHAELNANINGPSVLFRTHDFSMTMVQDGGKNDGKYRILLDSKPFRSAMLQLNVGTPSAPSDSQYNDIVVAAIAFNSASNALAFKSNNHWPNGNVINYDNIPDINNEINEWGYFEGFSVGGTNGNPADINSYPADAKMSELFGNTALLGNSGYGPSDLDKIIIVICERDRATNQTVQYFEKWFAFELVGPEVYPNGWV